MRISTAQLFQQRVTAMQNQQATLARTELQMSTGKRLVSPSDDPAASLRSLQLHEHQTMNQQYIENIDTAQSRLELEEGTLATGIDLLQRVRELAVNALNATLSPEDLKTVEVEVRSLMDGLVAVANTRNVSGEFMFSGYQSDTMPFAVDAAGTVTYNGDQGRQQLQVSASRQLPVTDNGMHVFMGVARAAGGTGSVFDVVKDFADALAAGAPAGETLTDIDVAMDQLTGVRADVGSRLRTAQEQRDINQSFGLVLDRERSDLVDLDYTEAVSKFNRELLALQASQQVFSKVQELNLFNYLR
ncbi:MAG: flagellar hook-associated protein FlgL [Pseudomonadota bacterium]